VAAQPDHPEDNTSHLLSVQEKENAHKRSREIRVKIQFSIHLKSGH